MKINLPQHNLKDVERFDAKDIPIGYVDTTDASYDISFTLNKDFSTDVKEQVFAYDTFRDKDILLFDGGKKLLKNIQYKRDGSTYVYEPSGCTEFEPAYFRAQVLVKRRMRYVSNNHYNLRVGVVEKDDKLTFSSSVITAFGDANKRGLCPSNITINDGSKMIQSLLATDLNALDFLFIRSSDGFDVRNTVYEAINKHVNVWLSVDSFDDLLMPPPSDFSAQAEGAVLCSFYKPTKRKKSPVRVFDPDENLEHQSYLRAVYEYSLPYEDVLIMHRPNGGYIIVTPSEFLSDTVSNIKIIYDVLMHTFMNGYREVLSDETWITNELADSMAYNFMPLNAYHKTINLNKMLSTPDYELNDEYDIASISSTTPNISCVKITPDKTLFFRKNGKAETDPKKPDGAISYITTKGTVLIYKPEEVYKLKSRANLVGQNNGSHFTITVKPLMDSVKHIYVPEEVTLSIPNPNKEWCVCVKGTTPDGTSVPKLVEKNLYSMNVHGYLIADVHINVKQKPQVIDTRVYGGGVPIREENNYDCIDIGNVIGRPYRLGSTLVIKLPKRLKDYEDIITKAVKEHIAAGEYPVILFE